MKRDLYKQIKLAKNIDKKKNRIYTYNSKEIKELQSYSQFL